MFGFKNMMERGIKKFLLSQCVKLHLKFLRKIILKPLQLRKDL